MTQERGIAIGAAIAVAAIVAVFLLTRQGYGDPPDAAEFERMTEEEQCEATVERAIPCTTELMIAQLRGLSTSTDVSGLEADVRGSRSDRKADRQVHRVTCASTPTYARAVFKCWKRDDCDAFADCVGREAFATSPR